MISLIFEYFTVLRVAASSAADPASRAAAATYESANGQMPGRFVIYTGSRNSLLVNDLEFISC